MRSGLYSKKYISSIMLLVLACNLLWLPGCRRVSMAREDDGYGDLFLCGDLAVQSAKFECVPCAGKKERATADVVSRLQLKGKAGPAEVFVAVGFKRNSTLICTVDGTAVAAEQVAFAPNDYLRSAMDTGHWNTLLDQLPWLQTQTPPFSSYLLYFYIFQVDIPVTGEVKLELHYHRPLTQLRENPHWGSLRAATQSEWAFAIGGVPLNGVTTVNLDKAKGLRLTECSQSSQREDGENVAFRLDQTAGATFYARWEADTSAALIVTGSIGLVLILAVLLVFLAKKKNDGHP